MKIATMGLIVWALPLAMRSEPLTEIFEGMADVISDADLPPAESEQVVEVPFVEKYAREISDSGLTESAFKESLRSYFTNLAYTARSAPFDDSSRRLWAAYSILATYDNASLSPLLSNAIIHVSSPSVVEGLSFRYAARSGFSLSSLELYRSADFKVMPIDLQSAAYRGLLSAQLCHGGSFEVTNRVAVLAREAKAHNLIDWDIYDWTMCRLWHDFSTSSNRYIAARSAQQFERSPASSNYLNRVITELEALPPGTMQMLSTNQFGQVQQDVADGCLP